MSEQNNQVVVVDGSGLPTSQNLIAGIVEQKRVLDEIYSQLMVPEIHFGIMPGTEKPTLLQPGAQLINRTFRLTPVTKTSREVELPGGHLEVIIELDMMHIGTVEKWGEGHGSASTMESKHRWRNAQRTCPICGQQTIIKGKEKFGGGWLCWDKKGGCGAKFADFDSAITEQVIGKIENTDIYDQRNTVRKMAYKRALVHGTINATACSDRFTQDMEDFTAEVNERKAQKRGAAVPPPNEKEVPEQKNPNTKNIPTRDGGLTTADKYHIEIDEQVEAQAVSAIVKRAVKDPALLQAERKEVLEHAAKWTPANA